MLLSLAAAGPARAGRETISIAVTEPQPATITGDLYTPSGKGPYPAVVLFHGCGGVSPNVPAWAQWLQSEGYAALVVNSFQGRGLRNLCADTRPLTPTVRAADVYAAAAKLQAMGVADGDRIAAMGFSHGGSTVLGAWRTQSKHPDVKLRALIALYPGCGSQRPPPPDATPLLILTEGKDDWTPAESCQTLTDASRAASASFWQLSAGVQSSLAPARMRSGAASGGGSCWLPQPGYSAISARSFASGCFAWVRQAASTVLPPCEKPMAAIRSPSTTPIALSLAAAA